MKELSIEEKAKRYDEAIERAESIYNETAIPSATTKGICTYIFPELKESEDERIRKALIYRYQCDGFLCTNGYRIDYKDIRAWLEKQGKQKSLDDIAKEVTKDKDAAVSFLKSTGIMNENGELADEYKIEQGEQKPTDEIKLKIEEGKWYVCISQFCNCIEGRAYKATSDNRVMDDFGTEYDMHSNAYKYFRLWTIQDAKDGDVLATLDYILIFKKILSKDGGVSYCHYDFGSSTPQFNFNEDDNWYFGKEAKVYPATKEQRDLLFQKMKEAGYEWNAEKKELKKNEPIPTAEGMKIISRTKCEFAEWSEEDESTINEVIMNYESAYLPPVDKRYNIINRLKSLKERYTWKPSDEQMNALWSTTEKYLESDDENVRKLRGEVLESLYNELKKLRNE